MAGFDAQLWPVPWYSLIYLRATQNLAATRLESMLRGSEAPTRTLRHAGRLEARTALPSLASTLLTLMLAGDLIGDLREALPDHDAATNGSCAGACPYPHACLVSRRATCCVPACTACLRTACPGTSVVKECVGYVRS